MFRLYRPDNYERGTPRIPVDAHDASKVGKGVAALPESHRMAIHWSYLQGGSPKRMVIGSTRTAVLENP
jgi:hypothetical protein